MAGIELIWKSRDLLADGLAQTILIAALALVFSCIGGFAVGWLRCLKNPIISVLTRLYLECFRTVPLMVLLFIAYFTVPTVTNLPIDGRTAAVLVFSLWGIAEMSELVRGAIQSLSKSQRESGMALGLSSAQLYLHVLLPQALRRLVPGTINLSTRLIKTTSLVTFVGVTDVVKRGQQIIERTKQPFPIYLFIFILFFVLCYPLSALSKHLERKNAGG